MSKPTKPTKRATPARSTPPPSSLAQALGATEPDSLLVRARSTVDKGITALDDQLDELIERLNASTEYSRDDASHLAWLTKMASGVLGDVRKIEERERVEAGKLSPQLVMAHLRGLTQERRAHIVRELVQMDDSEGNVLGT